MSDAGDALVDVAAAHGTDTFFGVVSIHNQPLIDAIERRARFVPVRHEAAAVNAADGYARAAGRLGVAVTSTGTGAGNAAGSMIEALAAGSPVLHVTGQIDAEYLGAGRGVIHETKDQRGLLDAVSKRAATARSAGPVGLLLEDAAAAALTAPQGPASVEIPIDVQYQPTSVPGSLPRSDPPVADADAGSEAVALIGAARRPVLWLGGGATRAAAEISELVDRTGCAVFTSNAGRGTLDEADARVVGNFAASPGGSALLEQADLLISVGTHFRSNETRHYGLHMPASHIQIDVDAAAIGRVYPATVGLVGDAAATVATVLADLETSAVEPAWTLRAGETRNAVREQLRDDIGPYAVLCDAMREFAPEQSPMVRDVTIPASAWGNRLLPIHDPETNVNARGGGIGQGVAMAIGAAIARPEVPTLLMVGDGGLAVHLGELGTLSQERPWLVVLLFNDQGYGVLRNLQDHHFGRRAGVDLMTPDFAVLAESFGLDHLLISAPEACRDTLAEAVALGGPVIVEVDCGSFGEMPKPFVPPVAQPSA